MFVAKLIYLSEKCGYHKTTAWNFFCESYYKTVVIQIAHLFDFHIIE